MTLQEPQFVWHVHHNCLCEMLIAPLQTRINYIKKNKPTDEVTTRLRLLRLVKHPERLPDEFVEACRKYNEACSEYDEAYSEYVEACSEYDKACSEYNEACRDKACRKWDKAYSEYVEACRKYNEACSEYDKACSEYVPQLEPLHAEECKNCPWDGRTIFPRPRPEEASP